MEREHGRIVSVSTGTLGSTLVGDHAAGATTLLVFDAGDFDEDGGTLNVGGATLAYASVDDDASTIALTDPLPAAALDGDRVDCWSTLYDVALTVKTAMVQLDGDDDNPDPIEAWVPHFLADKISDGDRGGPGESVVLGYDEEDDEWQITDVRGLAGASGAGVKFEANDSYDLTAADITAGVATVPLSHRPISESVVAFWGSIPQPPTEFTIDYNAQTVTFSLAGFEEAGDEIWVHYAYRDAPRPASIAFSPLDLPSLVAWYSADYEAQSLADGAAMTQWTDLSGKGNHAPISGSGAGTGNPIFEASAGLNGGPCVKYLIGYWFIVPSGIFAVGTGAEIYATIWAAGEANGAGHWALTTSNSFLDPVYAGADGRIIDMFGVGSDTAIFTPTMSIATWRRYNVQLGQSVASDWVARMDELEQFRMSTGSFTPAVGGGALGNRCLSASGSDQTLRHGCAFLFNAVLSDDERALMDQWLKDHPSGGVPA